jgi:diguanylate cyclase (GGDEF)-like protein
MLFQLPFAFASIMVLRSVGQIGQSGPIRAMLTSIFGVICAHFLAKPFLAAAIGSGESAKAYVNSVYAVASQVSTGVLLVAAGLFLMLLVIQKALEETILDAETDPLTGLTNRRGLSRMGPRLMAEAERQGYGLYVLMLDLDHFKRINDQYGHATGDSVLVAFARVLETLAAEDVLTVRMGGEEFALLVPDADSAPDGLDNRATRLGRAIRVALEPFEDRGMPPLTVSGGAVRYMRGETLEGMIARADQLAYRAKRAGRDRILHDRSDIVPERGTAWPEAARLVAG